MTVELRLFPSFLVTHFPRTRRALVGVHSKVLFSDVSAKLSQEHTSKFVTRRTNKNQQKPFFKKVFDTLLYVPILTAVVVGLVLFVPQAYYLINPAETVPVQATEQSSVLGGEFEKGTEAATDQALENRAFSYVPEKDESLPEGKWLVIPRIGVRTQLLEDENADDALSKGVWKVPGYAEAGDTTQPMILAAHRFGYFLWGQGDYWKYNSFYYLPDTEPGDIVEIIDDQRKWTYEIYAGEEGDLITDYDADMILYTCKFINSPVRHFRYARLVDPTADSQV